MAMAGITKRFFSEFSQPLWLGDQPIAGKTILIYPEQGMGDFMHFCRYVSLLEADAAKVILEVPSALISVISTLKGNFTLVEQGKPLPDFDLHCPIMSLPLAFKTSLATIPAEIPYLYADSQKRQRWRDLLGHQTIPRVGLVWAGSIGHKQDYKRSIPVQELQALLSLPMEFHALQKELRNDDLFLLGKYPQVHLHHNELTDFSDTAALIAELDLVISVDTSVAHLAGAMAKPVWILLPFAPDYRWLLERNDNPWYPTATLFRQTASGDWNGVIAEVSAKLALFS